MLECDRGLPECSLCIKAGRPCPGYANRATSFVNLNVENFGGHSTRKLRGQAATEAKTLQGQGEAKEDVNTSKNDGRTHMDLTGSRTGTEPLNSSFSVLDAARSITPGSIRYYALNAVYFKATDFRAIHESLWNSFCNAYCITKSYWPKALSGMADRNQLLDLALVALSAKRLSVGKYPELRILAYDAYGRSLGLFRAEVERRQGENAAVLVVISMVYFLFEACSFTLEQVFTNNDVAFGHLRGALTLMSLCGPRIFSVAGFHEVLQKIREKVTVMSLVGRQETIFSEQQWMSVPWSEQQKGWRDILYDIATRLTRIRATHGGHSATGNDVYQQQLLALDVRIKQWRAAWLAQAFPLRREICVDQCAPRSCICHLHDISYLGEHDTLLQVECLALQLFVRCELLYTKPSEGTNAELGIWGSSDGMRREHSRLSEATKSLRRTLALPSFRTSDNAEDVITEGRCRSVLPLLVLKVYNDATSSETEGDSGQSAAFDSPIAWRSADPSPAA